MANRWQLGREMSLGTPATWEQTGAMVEQFMLGACPGLGVTPDNMPLWMDDLACWMKAMDTLLQDRPYCFGDRPSLADFAIAGPCVAHFHGDPACRRIMEARAPALRAQVERLIEPEEQEFGDWCAPDDVPDSLIALLAHIGSVYLPWIAAACSGGSTDAMFDGQAVSITPSPSTQRVRDIMLARYAAAKSDSLDAILDRAGILQHFAGHASTLSAPPAYETPPRDPTASALSDPLT